MTTDTLTDYVRNFDDRKAYGRFTAARDAYVLGGMEIQDAELKAFKETFPILEVPKFFGYGH